MFIIAGRKSAIAEAVRGVIEDAEKKFTSTFGDIKTVSELTAKIVTLRNDISKLSIEKAQKEEEFQKKEREIEHKVGLERKRQEFEIEAAKREALVSVREENLKADRQRFTDEMKFQNDRFTQEVGYLKDMIKQVLDRVPNVSAKLHMEGGKK